MKKKVLITGACGFIGRNLIPTLCENGYKCVSLDRILFPDKNLCGVESIVGNFSDVTLLDQTLPMCDTIIHLASNSIPEWSNNNIEEDVSSNLVGTLRLLNSAITHSISRFIFISSGGTVYGKTTSYPTSEDVPSHPICSYGIVKNTIEQYLDLASHMHGISTCSLRLANPYGPFQKWNSAQGVIAVFCHKVLTAQPIDLFGNGEIKRDFVYIKDVVSAILSAVNNRDAQGEINIGSGRATSIGEIVKTLAKITGVNPLINRLPARSFDTPVSYLDISKAEKILEWHPETDLLTGVQWTIEWQKNELINQ